MSLQAFREAWIAGLADRGLRRGLAASAFVGVVLALAGAFGTGAVPLWSRLAYWIGLATGGTLIGTTVSRQLLNRSDLEQRPYLSVLIVSLVLTVPLLVLVWLTNNIVLGLGLTWDRLLWTSPIVWVLTLSLTGLNLLIQHQPELTHAGPAPAEATAVRFMERLPVRLKGARLWAVSAEDHYLRLHTDLGQDLILMRLSDAVVELEGIEGARVHRSWWVARNAVRGYRREGGKLLLILQGDLTVPVSRTLVKSLTETGWLEG